MAVNNYQQENIIWKITILEIMCTFCLHCFDEYCLSRFHYAQLFLGDGITFDHNHKINIVTLTTMYMYISEPLYIFKTLMSSFLRIFVLSPTPLKLVLHSYPEARNKLWIFCHFVLKFREWQSVIIVQVWFINYCLD